jgi:hypothetical protein
MEEHNRYLILRFDFSAIAKEPGKDTGGSISLHRLLLVFHGGDCVLHEEV